MSTETGTDPAHAIRWSRTQQLASLAAVPIPPVPARLNRRPSDSEFRFKFVSLDGKVFPFEGFRGSHALNRACFSSKTQTSGLQTLVWSMPCGTPILVTGLFAAKLSEKRQVQIHSKWLAAIPGDVAILEDRGFRKLQRYYPK